MLDSITILHLVLYIGVVIFAAVVHGTLGLGFPMIATPMLSTIVDVRTAILVTLIPTIVINLISIATGKDWKNSIGEFWQFPVWALAGGLIGSYLIVISDPSHFKILLALLVFLYLIVERSNRAFFGNLKHYKESAKAGFGLASGIAAGSTNTMVPIMIIYALEMGWSRSLMVPVFNVTFLSGKLSQILVFVPTKVFTWQIALATLPFAALAGLVLLLGVRIRQKIYSDLYIKIIKFILFLLGVILVIQFFQGL